MPSVWWKENLRIIFCYLTNPYKSLQILPEMTLLYLHYFYTIGFHLPEISETWHTATT